MKNKCAFLAFFMMLFVLPNEAFAITSVVDGFQTDIRGLAKTWFQPIQDIALWLLLTLSVISYTWNAIQLLLKQADFQSYIAELVRMILFTGFFVWLIKKADWLVAVTMKGFVWLAGHANSSVYNMEVGSILEKGLALGSDIIAQGSFWTLIIYALLGLIVVILYALICAQVFFVFAEMYVVTAAGVILLGFGGSQWTSEYAKKYFSYCLGIGMKLYATYMVVGAGDQMINTWAAKQSLAEYSSLFAIIAILLILFMLVKMIPDIAQGIISGASIGSATPSVGGMAGAAAGAVAGAATGGAASMMALKAASSLAGSQLAGGGAGLAKHMGQTASNLGKAFAGSAKEKLAGNTQRAGMINQLNEALKNAPDSGGNGSISSGSKDD